MSKFCQNCGNMLDDNAAFCDRCGKPFEAPDIQPAAPQYEAPAAPQYEAPAAPQYEDSAAPQYQASQAAPYEPVQYGAPQQYAAPEYGAPRQYGTQTAVAEKKNPLQACLRFIKEKKILVISIAAVLIVAIVLLIVLPPMFNNNASGALTKAFNCTKNLDIRGVSDVSYEMNFSTGSNKEEQIKEAESQMNQYGSILDMFKSMMKDAKLKITKDEVVSADELKNLKESWASSYKDTDKITEIHKIDYEITVMGSTESDSCYSVKVGGKWYVQGFSSPAWGI